MTPTVTTFKEALGSLAPAAKKHVLLGNGFSIACQPNIFTYEKLIDQADFGTLSEAAKGAFSALQTADFEVVMEGLKRASKLVGLYGEENRPLAKAMAKDAEALKEVLVSTIAKNHPTRPGDIDPKRYAACKRFLSHFGHIYTLNYDLLLYWAVMQDEVLPAVDCDDGFRQPDDGPQPWVSWTSSAHGQNLLYLHGGLHIFEAGHEIQKYTWCNTDEALIDQIRAALEAQKYPLFVAEGTWEQKMTRIQKSNFLGRAYRSLQSIGGTLFIYGLSFGPNDDHVSRAIAQSTVSDVYVSVYGDPASPDNRGLMGRAQLLSARREEAKKSSRKRTSLNVHFYQAESAAVWGSAKST